MLSQIEQRIQAEIAARYGAMVEDLRRFVAMQTGPASGDLDAQRISIGERMSALGASVERIAGEPRPSWLYAEPGERGANESASTPLVTEIWRSKHGASDKALPILISGHLDTVHAKDSPFQRLTIDADGRMARGPGCADMKGGLVLAIHALEAIERAGILIPWRLVLNSDEETGSFASASAIRRIAKEVAFAGGVGLALEPCLPDGSIVTERLGSGQFRIHATGKAAHVGRDFAAGRSAVTALAKSIVEISTISDPSRRTIANIGPIRGGATTNSVPDSAYAWGNLRFPNAQEADGLTRVLREICQRTSGDGTTQELEIALSRPAKSATERSDRLAHLVKAIGGDLGMNIGFTSTGGVCDGNLMQDEGLPTIDTLGVRGGGLHTTDEWIDLSSLTERCTLLACTILRATRQRL